MALANVTSGNIITTGFPEVDDLLATLESKLQKKAIRKGTRAGAKIVESRAKSFVPHDTGVLESTLTVRVASRKGRFGLKKGEIGHSVTHRTTGADDPFYSHFVEFGTVNMEGDTYIRPALFDSKDKVLAASTKAITKEVNSIRIKVNAPPRFKVPG